MNHFVQEAVDVIVGITKGILIACIPPPINFIVTTAFDLITGRISIGSVISNMVSSFTGFCTDIFGNVASSIASEVSVSAMDDCFSRNRSRARVQATDITLNGNLYNIKDSYYDRLHNDFTFNFRKKDNNYNDITSFMNNQRTTTFNFLDENNTGFGLSKESKLPFDILKNYMLPSTTKTEPNYSKLIYNPLLKKDDSSTNYLTMGLLDKFNNSNIFKPKKCGLLTKFDDI